jgi:hypothetical protein
MHQTFTALHLPALDIVPLRKLSGVFHTVRMFPLLLLPFFGLTDHAPSFPPPHAECPWRYNLSVLATNTDQILTTLIEQDGKVCGAGDFIRETDWQPNRAAGFVVPPPRLDRTGQVGRLTPQKPRYLRSEL